MPEEINCFLTTNIIYVSEQKRNMYVSLVQDRENRYSARSRPRTKHSKSSVMASKPGYPHKFEGLAPFAPKRMFAFPINKISDGINIKNIPAVWLLTDDSYIRKHSN